ncbi:MAG TPA: molybdopterin biosynthesis protein [Thermodesulfovibrionales bacterium]|nr:molybdopterin biosynthesis protein [Thermodesulfovibrionales bacterium]
MSRTVYLENTPLQEAVSRWLSRLETENALGPLPGETIGVVDALGRITAQAIAAMISSPFYHSSAMDGYAVRFAETFGASERTPKRLRIGAEAVAVDTGDPMPEGFNAVVMIEDVNVVPDPDEKGGPGSIEIISPATPWQHVRVIGEDIVATELVLPENQAIRPVDMGAMLAGGHTDVRVRRKPRVAIIPTGDEVVEPGSPLGKGNIIEYNSRILGGLVTEWGGECIRYDIVPDDPSELKKAILDACDRGDIVVVNAGSSAGSEDFTAGVIRELGEVLLHGVNIRPGKPVVLGIVGGKPVLGIPGYPVSAYITFNLFVKPIVFKRLGLDMGKPDVLSTRISRQVASQAGQEEFVRVKIGKVGDRFISTPLSRGAGVLMSLVRADGFARIPAMSEGLGAGSEVDVELLRSREEIENTIVCIGSHDNALDLLANILRKRHSGYSLSSAHVGSMGGLIALKKGEAHMAGTHLLDEETGEYNISFVKKILSGRNIVLINLVYREQGLLVLKGNPKGIRGFGDLTRKDVVFVNRQAGAGTRLLTDKSLKEQGIDPRTVKGYEREEYTHMGVASAVLTGVADTGLAILASARALDLDFIPVAKERYDIAVPREFLGLEMLQALLAIIREDKEFKDTVSSMGGYDVSDMGKILFES